MKKRLHQVETATAILCSIVLIGIASSQQPSGPPPGGGPPLAGPAAPGGPDGPAPAPDVKFAPYIDVDNGVYKLENSREAKLTGSVGNNSATGIRVTSSADNLNTFYVTGRGSNYVLADSTIDTHGNGGNDFAGIGAAIMSDNGATLTLRKVRVETNGLITPAVVNTGNGTTLRVYDSTLIANGGELPRNYKPRIGPGMMEPPSGLLIHGTTRAVLTMGAAKSYFYNTTVIAQGWGALSTDAAHDAYVEANHCDIQVIRSGYGMYADNGAHVVINDSKISSASYLGVIAGAAEMDLNEDTGGAGANAVMIHSVMGRGPEIGVLKIKGGKLMADYATVLIKSANADISLTGADLSSKLGTILFSPRNEDRNATQVNGQKVTGVRVTLQDEHLQGDLVNEDSDREMALSFHHSTLKGAIRSATISLDAESTWTATSDSTVTLAGNVDVAQLDASTGVTISASAGQGCRLHGSYKLPGGGTVTVL